MSSYNTTLQSNNTDLQAILNTINELPEAVEQATPVISVNNSNGLITATAGAKTSTHQLAFQAAKTITPSTASQIAVSSGYYTGGNITVAAIPSTYVKPSYTKAAATYTPTTANQTISAGTYLTGAQTIKGDSNLVAGNIKSGVSIFGVNGNYVGSSGDGGSSAEDGLITRTLTSYTNDRITSIGGYAFGSYSSLTTVNFPAVTEIGDYAFYYCTSLTTVSFPAATIIRSNAFNHCSSLTTASFPVATSISAYAFNYCSSLTTANFPVATYIATYAFNCCRKLTSVSFPAATFIGDYAFSYCSSLTTVSFPVATKIGGDAFYSCSRLTGIYLTASSVCTLSNSNAFSKTGIWSTKGSIFVPTSLVASYKSATNWTFFSNRIYGI